MPNMTDISNIPMGNFTIQTIAKECVYLNYAGWLFANIVLLGILLFRVNRWVESHATINDNSFANRRLRYLLSDDFYIASLFNLNIFLGLYTLFHATSFLI